MTPSSTSVSTFIGSPTTVDSVAIGAYSLNGGLMTGGVSPGSVGTSTTNTLTYNLRNTPTSSDPFPDEVDFVALEIPNQTFVTVPTSTVRRLEQPAGRLGAVRHLCPLLGHQAHRSRITDLKR